MHGSGGSLWKYIEAARVTAPPGVCLHPLRMTKLKCRAHDIYGQVLLKSACPQMLPCLVTVLLGLTKIDNFKRSSIATLAIASDPGCSQDHKTGLRSGRGPLVRPGGRFEVE